VPPRTNIILDDRLLLDYLLEVPTKELRQAVQKRAVFTTGFWYYRLCHAVRSDTVTGALSGPFEKAERRVRELASVALVKLPENVGLLSLRELAPMMAEGVERHRLNVMSLEALAAAMSVNAEIAMAVGSENPLLTTAAKAEGLKVRIVRV
jgi:hypothetical protein